MFHPPLEIQKINDLLEKRLCNSNSYLKTFSWFSGIKFGLHE